MNTQFIPIIVIGIIIGAAIAIVPFVIWNRRHPGNFWPYMAGMICFVVFALVLEHFFNNAILRNPDSTIGQAILASDILYGIYGGLAAGVFEETGRLFAFKVLLKNRTDESTGVAYGIGHGGVEVLYVFGVNWIYVLLIICGVAIADEETVLSIQNQISTFGSMSAMMAVSLFERLYAMMAHVGFSMLVFKAARDKNRWWLYPLAILLHAVVDFVAALYQRGAVSLLFPGLWGFIWAAFSFWLGIKFLYGGKRTKASEGDLN